MKPISYKQEMAGGAWKGFIPGRAPQDPAPFQSDEITGFDFGRSAGWVER